MHKTQQPATYMVTVYSKREGGDILASIHKELNKKKIAQTKQNTQNTAKKRIQN